MFVVNKQTRIDFTTFNALKSVLHAMQNLTLDFLCSRPFFDWKRILKHMFLPFAIRNDFL